jgi:uncharacterized protein YceK
MTKRVWMVMCITIFLSGCSSVPTLNFYHAKDDESEVETLKTVLVKEEKTSEAIGVFFNHQLVVAVQVRPLSKFGKEKVEKRISKKLKKEFPNREVFVSSDLKIMWELKDLVKEEPSDKTLKKKLKDIKSLAKEET